MIGRYQLKRQVGSRGHYAFVEMHIELMVSGPEIFFNGKALPRLRGQYGLNAIINEADLDVDGQAVKWGIDYALCHVPDDCDGSGVRVVVNDIRSMIVDTTPGGLAFAACYAVWDALGVEGQAKPFIDKEGIHFPDTTGDVPR